MNLKDIINGDKMCLKWEIEDLTIRLIHSRKLNIKALVTFCATVDETEQIRLPVALDAEEVSVRKKQSVFWDLPYIKKIHSGSRMSIPLPPIVRISPA